VITISSKSPKKRKKTREKGGNHVKGEKKGNRPLKRALKIWDERFNKDWNGKKRKARGGGKPGLIKNNAAKTSK